MRRKVSEQERVALEQNRLVSEQSTKISLQEGKITEVSFFEVCYSSLQIAGSNSVPTLWQRLVYLTFFRVLKPLFLYCCFLANSKLIQCSGSPLFKMLNGIIIVACMLVFMKHMY